MDQPDRTIHIGETRVDLFADGGTFTTIDGITVPAYPQDDEGYRGRARSLGYGDDVGAMSRDHELAHSILAVVLGQPASPTLRGVSTGSFWPHWKKEEGAVLAFQAFARALDVDLADVADRIGLSDIHSKDDRTDRADDDRPRHR